MGGKVTVIFTFHLVLHVGHCCYVLWLVLDFSIYSRSTSVPLTSEISLVVLDSIPEKNHTRLKEIFLVQIYKLRSYKKSLALYPKLETLMFSFPRF